MIDVWSCSFDGEEFCADCTSPLSCVRCHKDLCDKHGIGVVGDFGEIIVCQSCFDGSDKKEKEKWQQRKNTVRLSQSERQVVKRKVQTKKVSISELKAQLSQLN